MCKIHTKKCKENVHKFDKYNFHMISNDGFFIYFLKCEKKTQKITFIQLVYLNALSTNCNCLIKLILKMF